MNITLTQAQVDVLRNAYEILAEQAEQAGQLEDALKSDDSLFAKVSDTQLHMIDYLTTLIEENGTEKHQEQLEEMYCTDGAMEHYDEVFDMFAEYVK